MGRLNQIDNNTGKKRLLAVYDLAAQPCSIGDFLNFVQATYTIAVHLDFSKVDYCFISDPNDCTIPEFVGKINENNRFYYLFSILPIVQFNPLLGSILIYDSISDFLKYGAKADNNYSVWPPLEDINNKKYVFYDICMILAEINNQRGSLPLVTARQDVIAWTGTFYSNHVFPKIPVTVNIRNNGDYHSHRNSDLQAWKELFNYCEKRYPVKFVIICGTSEIDRELQMLKNVIFAKTENTGIEQDLALIQTSAIHLGNASGPATMATYTRKPYIIMNTDMGNYIHLYNGSFLREGEYLRFTFSYPKQRFATFRETSQNLIEEFENMWYLINPEKWIEDNFKDNYSIGSLTNLR